MTVAAAAACSGDEAFSGGLLARVTAVYLGLAALMVLVALLVFSALAWWYVSMLSDELLIPRVMLAFALAQLLLLPGGWLTARLLWRRARSLWALRPGRGLATRVMALLLRTFGEGWALFFVFSSLAAAAVVAIAGDQLVVLDSNLVRLVAGYPAFLQTFGFLLLGVLLVALGASLAAMALLMGGLFADGLTMLLQLADDTHDIRERLEAAERVADDGLVARR